MSDRHPFDADRIVEGFEEVETVQAPVPADSELARVMADARESWAAAGGSPDPDDFRIEPNPVDLD